MKRLRDTPGNELARAALRSARADGPSRRARERTALALGVSAAAGVTAATTSAAASLPSMATGAIGASHAATGTAAGVNTSLWGIFRGMPLVAKAMSLTLATAALATGGTMLHLASVSSTNAPASPVAATSPDRRAPVLSPAPEPAVVPHDPTLAREELATVSPVVAVHDPSAAGTPTVAMAPSANSVRRPAEPAAASIRMGAVVPPEATASAGRGQDWSQGLSVLEAARAALAAGDATRALAVVDDYDRRFPNGALAPEATVLRIEALVASGSNREALALSDRFLSANANGPHARHVRAVVASIREASLNR